MNKVVQCDRSLIKPFCENINGSNKDAIAASIDLAYLIMYIMVLFFFFGRFLYYQDNMMEMQVVGRSKAEVKRKVAKQC